MASKINVLDESDFEGYDNKRGKVWHNALRRAIKSDDGKRLRRAADKLLDAAADGESWAIRELADRVDGKAEVNDKNANLIPNGSITVNIIGVEASRETVIEHEPADPMIVSIDTLDRLPDSLRLTPRDKDGYCISAEPIGSGYGAPHEDADTQQQSDESKSMVASLIDCIPTMGGGVA